MACPAGIFDFSAHSSRLVVDDAGSCREWLVDGTTKGERRYANKEGLFNYVSSISGIIWETLFPKIFAKFSYSPAHRILQ